MLFALAMLAGWGLDELTRRERAAAAPPPAGAGGRGGDLLRADRLDARRPATLAPSRLGAGARGGLGLRGPAALAPAARRGVCARRRPVLATSNLRLSALLQWLPLAGAGLALVALGLGAPPAPRRRAPGRPPSSALAVAVLVVDLFRANMGFNPAIPIEHAEQPTTPALRYLQSRTPEPLRRL